MTSKRKSLSVSSIWDSPFKPLKVNIWAPKQTPTGHKPVLVHMCSALKTSKRPTQVTKFFPPKHTISIPKATNW